MLFTARRLRRCCFPSKEAETGEQARAIQYPAMHGWGLFESREKDFIPVFVSMSYFTQLPYLKYKTNQRSSRS